MGGSYAVIFTSVILVILVAGIDCMQTQANVTVKCFVCDSQEDERCTNAFKHWDILKRQDGCNQCKLTRVRSKAGPERMARECVRLAACKESVTLEDNHSTAVHCCKEPLCNGASAVSMATAAIFVILPIILHVIH